MVRNLLARHTAPYLAQLISVSVISVLASFALMLPPLVLAPAIDLLAPTDTPPANSFTELSLNNLGVSLLYFFSMGEVLPIRILWVSALVYVGLSILGTFLDFVSNLWAIKIRTKISRDMQQALFRKMISLPLSYFHQKKSGDLSTLYLRDVPGTAHAVDIIFKGIFQNIVKIFFYAVALLKTNAELTLIVFLFGSCHLLITRVLGKNIKRKIMSQNKAAGRLGGLAQEIISNIRIIKIFNAGVFEQSRFKDETEHNRRRDGRYLVSRLVEAPLRASIQAVLVVLVLVLAFGALEEGSLSTGGFVLFLVLTRQLTTPIAQLSSHILSFVAVTGCAERIRELYDQKSCIDSGTLKATELQHRLKVNNLSFAYVPGHNVLSDVTFDIERGQTVAVVGLSGAGKSTLIDLIENLYEPTSGEILYDDKPIQTFTMESYRRQLGVVPQDCLLFDMSIRENICYGRPENILDLEAALKNACADIFVQELEEGLDTKLLEGGRRLSGGQKQRIAVARAIYQKPSVLILDEATSALDPITQYDVFSALDKSFTDHTLLIIAHQLETVKQADQILVLDRGRLVAQGIHTELMESCELYKRICRTEMHADRGSSANEQGRC